MKIRVVPEARSLDPEAVAGQAVVVIDVLRATTTIACAVAAGARVEPVRSIAEARRRAGRGVLIAGERGGRQLRGFDLGNSPIEASTAAVRGLRLVLTTTNGTLAIARAAAARVIYAGALVNARAVARALCRQRTPRELFLVCAGRTTGIALEDLAGAGALLDALLGDDADEVSLTDGARLSLELFRRQRRRLAPFLRECESGRNLARLGLDRDLAQCARLDAVDVAPRLRGDRFVA